MAATARRWRTVLALLLAGGALLGAGACTSEQESALSALHYFQRGNAAFQAEDYSRAVEHYRMALQFDADAPDIHYNLGLAYYKAGDYEDAAQAFKAAVKLDPAFAEAHLNLALAYDKLYNASAANLHYNRYRALVTGQQDRDAATAGASPPAGSAAQAAARAVPVRTAVAGRPGGVPAGAPAGRPAGVAQSAAVQAARELRRGRPAPAPTHGAPATQEAPNPFEGNAKWWTQDTGNLNR